MTKTVLFVTYGGGHARMVIPVMRALADSKDIRTEAIALTSAGPIFASEGVPYKGFRDFITPGDDEALEWGRKLARSHHSPESGIDEEESIAYLGLSYWDLVMRHGEDTAAMLWASKGRHAFLPLIVMERVFETLRPDMVVTTNSPKSEQAAIEMAIKHNLHTLSMVDLFGIQHFHAIEAETITVLCQQTIDNMRREGVNKPDSAFKILGNPAFDPAFDHRGPVDYVYRKIHFPKLQETAPILLWVDSHAYWDLEKQHLHTRTDAEIVRDLDTLAMATRLAGGSMLIRPHPSQPRRIYDLWLQSRKPPNVEFAGGLPLYPLLKAIDAVATYNSTVSVEALLMERKVLQLKYHQGDSDMPLGQWGVAWIAHKPEELQGLMRAVFTDDEAWQAMKAKAATILPQHKASPEIAALITQVLL